jgi:hypothetical protein
MTYPYRAEIGFPSPKTIAWYATRAISLLPSNPEDHAPKSDATWREVKASNG